MYVFVDNHYLLMLGQLCAWAESTWPAVGTVDRHGHQKGTICDTCGLCQRNRSILKPIFCQFRWILCAYMSLRYLDLKMWWFLCWQQTKPIALPLAHARGVISSFIIYGYRITINLHLSVTWNALCPLTIISSLEERTTAQVKTPIDGLWQSPTCTQDWVGEE